MADRRLRSQDDVDEVPSEVVSPSVDKSQEVMKSIDPISAMEHHITCIEQLALTVQNSQALAELLAAVTVAKAKVAALTVAVDTATTEGDQHGPDTP